jgi:hypothetical protein
MESRWVGRADEFIFTLLPVGTMKWLKDIVKLSVSIEVHHNLIVQFLGDQDGLVEQEIKARWIPILEKNSSVRRAYLAITKYGDSGTNQVTLCIVHSKREDPALVNELAEPFRQTFNNSVALDIIFITTSQELKAKKVCNPFYDTSPAG